ncbi:MAG: hypothetical protein AAFV96_07680 [Pseudomonadota bacterium]
MPTPILLNPVTLRLAALGGVAVAGAVMRARRARSSVQRDRVLDEAEEGLAVGTEPLPNGRQVNAEGRWVRVFRVGPRGPGVEVDLAGALRARVRAVPPER